MNLSLLEEFRTELPWVVGGKYLFLEIFIMITENMLLRQLTPGMTQKAQSWSILRPLTVRQIQARTKLYTPVSPIPEEHNL